MICLKALRLSAQNNYCRHEIKISTHCQIGSVWNGHATWPFVWSWKMVLDNMVCQELEQRSEKKLVKFESLESASLKFDEV